MQKDLPKNIAKDKRSEPRKAKLRNYRIEIKFVGKPIYQFRVRNISGHRASVLVKEDSSILKSLTIGQKLKMNYWTGEHLGETKTWLAEIKHITKQICGSLKGHFIVGFSIINNSD